MSVFANKTMSGGKSDQFSATSTDRPNDTDFGNKNSTNSLRAEINNLLNAANSMPQITNQSGGASKSRSHSRKSNKANNSSKPKRKRQKTKKSRSQASRGRKSTRGQRKRGTRKTRQSRDSRGYHASRTSRSNRSNQSRKSRGSKKKKSYRKSARSNSDECTILPKRKISRGLKRISRENPGFAAYLKLAEFIRNDMNLGGGPYTIAFVSHFRQLAKKENPNATTEELIDATKDIYLREKKAGNLEKIYEKKKREVMEKREAKKKAKKAIVE